MASQLSQLSMLCADLRSDKPASRIKAAERVNTVLTNSKEELIEFFSSREGSKATVGPELFNSVVDAAFQHAAKVESLTDAKAIQTMLNKNHIYRETISKLIDYNMESRKKFLTKSILYDAFCSGFNSHSAVKIFGSLYLQILERGILKIPSYIQALKADEYTSILSCLFELNIRNDDMMRFEILNCIVKTTEIALEYCQISGVLIDYLAEILPFARKAHDDRRKADVFKLYNFFVSRLAIDYHNMVSEAIQDIIPVLCDLYSVQFKPEIKEIFFKSVHSSLHVIYPYIDAGSFLTIHVTLKESWPKTLKRLKSVIDLEIREHKMRTLCSRQTSQKNSLGCFIDMSSIVVYLINWNPEDSAHSLNEANEPKRKIPKEADKLVTLFEDVLGKDSTNEVWISILCTLLANQTSVLNDTNYHQLLKILSEILVNNSSAVPLRSIRIALLAILEFEKNKCSIIEKESSWYKATWHKIIKYLISDTSELNDVVTEKQYLIQGLIKHGKLSTEECMQLIQSITTNSVLRRKECFETIRQILIYANQCGIDKSSKDVERIITWAYETNEKVSARSILLNIASTDISLINDMCAIAVINFFNDHKIDFNIDKSLATSTTNLKMLLYKYNNKLICLEEHAKEVEVFKNKSSLKSSNPADEGNCLFQSNYEFLMQTLNPEVSGETTINSIIKDISSLHKLSNMMKIFIDYSVFTESNFSQCPLIKRIGFFLNQLNLQLKSIDSNDIDNCDVLKILKKIEDVANTFISTEILLRYLESQSLSELVCFVGRSLMRISQKKLCDIDVSNQIKFSCLQILAKLCSSDAHRSDAFANFSRYDFNIESDLNILLSTIKVFCLYRMGNRPSPEVAHWIVDKLKLILKSFYTNIEIIEQIVEILPGIFDFVQLHNDLLDTMYIALTSLLKVAYKKFYSTHLASKIINSVRFISRQSDFLLSEQSFINICISITKFIAFPSLEIQFAVINTVTALMDENWIEVKSVEGRKDHFELCQQILDSLDWKELPDITTDLEKNRNSVVVQLLVSWVAFSSYHQEHALAELAYFCALRKFKETDLYVFRQVAEFHKCTLTQLTRPYMFSLISGWMEKKYPILKYPYFLSNNNQDDFIKQNISTIAACYLLFSKHEDLKKLNKYAIEKHLIKMALPVVKAFILPYKAACAEAQNTEYQRNIHCLRKNLENYDIDILNSLEDLGGVLHWETMYFCTNLVMFDTSTKENLGFSFPHRKQEWYHICPNSLKRCLNYYLNGGSCVNEVTKAFMNTLMKNARKLLSVFNALKEDIYLCTFPKEKLICFNKYFLTVELVVDSVRKDGISTTLRDVFEFLIRNIILFTLQLIQNVQETDLQKAGFKLFLYMLEKEYIAEGECRKLIKARLNDIIKCLVTIVKNNASGENAQLSSQILKRLVADYNLDSLETVLEEFPGSNDFDELRDVYGKQLTCINNQDLRPLLKSFLSTEIGNNCGMETIIKHITKNISEFNSEENNLLHDVIRHLIEIVRNGEEIDLNLGIAKCLGEIGSIKTEEASFYFQTKNLFYDTDTNSPGPDFDFVMCAARAVDKLLMTFKASTYKNLCDVATLLTNTKFTKKLLDAFPYFLIFQCKLESREENTNWSPHVKTVPIDWISIVKNTETLDGNDWISAFVAKTFENCGWNMFRDLALKDWQFAAETLQSLMKLLIPVHMDNLLNMLNYFFDELCIILEGGHKDNRKIYKDKRIIRTFLDICECIRIHNSSSLSIKLLNVAKASNYCQAYFMSIMYTELWAISEEASNSDNQSTKNKRFQEVAIKAYQSIGCYDAISGFLNPIDSRLEYLFLNNDWTDILIENNYCNTLASRFCTTALKNNGIHFLADLNKKNENQEVDYEICWRLCQWDVPVKGHQKVNNLNDLEYEYEKHHYNALKCLHNREEQNCLAGIKNARICVISILKEISIECLQSVYKYLTWLQVLQQTEDFCQVQFISEANVESIFTKWQAERNFKYGTFQCKEMILTHQITLFNAAGVRGNRKIRNFFQYNPVEIRLLECIKECKRSGEINLAKSNLAALRALNISNEHVKLNMLLEEAEVCFRTGRLEMTEAILKHALSQKELLSCPQQARALRMYGEYLLETNSQTFEYVLEKMFNRSLQFLEKILKFPKYKDSEKDDLRCLYFDNLRCKEFYAENCKNVYRITAKYADREYVQANDYINSAELKLKCRIIEKNRQTADLACQQKKDTDIRTGIVLLKKSANLDETEIKAIDAKRTTNLCIAVQNYIKYCQTDSNSSISSIYRIFALWFANKPNQDLLRIIKEEIGEIPTYKFICALNQITARLNSKNKDFIAVIKGILLKCLQDHPQHTLYQLYSLIYDNDASETNTRVSLATNIISSGRNKENALCVKQFAHMFSALIEFSNAESGKSSSMMLSDKLKRLQNLHVVQCPTVDLPVSPNKTYSIISIVKWEEKVGLVGGINAPKKLECICSDGKTRPQLLKGKDDLRQDAIMQQYFSMINTLLSKNPKTSESNIRLRTYKVVPLSMRSGILEWCEHTIPIGLYLGSAGSNGGAHKKYRPNDLAPQKCRQLANQHLKSEFTKRLAVYEQICEKIKPVFHYFLLEKFLIPGIWFERRSAYTNSVAVNSMVGFIVGLGDRHTQNLLIDEKTAEIIHIDFGIAFEQGRIMPTPETVPFRLTRDMVAPMGISGTNGVFKKSCQAILDVLRKNRSVIITILEVLLYDPLYIWNVVPKAEDEVNGKSDEENLTAQRALLCVQQKLEGKIYNSTTSVNVDVQVQRVINEATSKRNLCLLYPGWDPYL